MCDGVGHITIDSLVDSFKIITDDRIPNPCQIMSNIHIGDAVMHWPYKQFNPSGLPPLQVGRYYPIPKVDRGGGLDGIIYDEVEADMIADMFNHQYRKCGT